jgi:hypothetical protein
MENLNNQSNKSIKELLKYVENNELATCDSDNYMNLFINRKKYIFGKEMQETMKIVHAELSYKSCSYYWKCSQSRRLEEIYSEMLGLYFNYDTGEKFTEIFLCDILDMYIKEKKIIFLVLDIVDYGLDDEKVDINEYVPHTCLMLLIPHKNKYNAYYINSHGKDSLIYTSYGYKISKRKKKIIHYDAPVDAMFINTYVQFLNKHYNTNINYDFSEVHNYYGANYQAGDNYGICFIFPYIFWYFFGMYYTRQRSIILKGGEEYKIKSNNEYLLNGDLTECIHGFLFELNKNCKKIIIQSLKSQNYNRKYYTLKLDKALEKSGNYFVKKILNVFIPFFMEKNII